MARIGIMGGTFDPIHFGHLDCARNAQRALELDEVLFMPAALTNFKQGRDIAPASDRLAMCTLAVAEEPTWHVSALEIERGGTTYTIDTLRELHALKPADELFFLTGSDALSTIDSWYGADELARLAVFVAVERPGYGMPDKRRDELMSKGFIVHCVVNEGFDISSSEIRDRVAAGESIAEMVPQRVAVYIDSHRLYRS